MIPAGKIDARVVLGGGGAGQGSVSAQSSNFRGKGTLECADSYLRDFSPSSPYSELPGSLANGQTPHTNVMPQEALLGKLFGPGSPRTPALPEPLGCN